MKWWEKGTIDIANDTVPSVTFHLRETDSSEVAASNQLQASGVDSDRNSEALEPEARSQDALETQQQTVPLPPHGKKCNQSQTGQCLHGGSSPGDVTISTIGRGIATLDDPATVSADAVAHGVKQPLDYSSTSTLCSGCHAEVPESPHWRRGVFDNLSLAAIGLGLGNIWRLPSLIFSTYPGETLIAYVILMTIVGLPVLMLEMMLGQFSSSGIIRTWQALPILKGIGVAQLLSGFYLSLYYPSLMAWAFQFGVSGIGGWTQCSDRLNLTTCLCSTDCDEWTNITIAEKCFHKEVLHQDVDMMNTKLLPMLATAVIAIALCSSFGSRTAKLCTSISGLLTGALLCASLALALTVQPQQDGKTALLGIQRLYPSQLWAFSTVEVWYGAMVQVIFSLMVGFGTISSLCSDRVFHSNVVRNAILVWFINIGSAIVSVLAAFAWAGLADLEDGVVHDHASFIYVIYYHASKSMWAGLAFALIFLAGLNSMIPQFYALIHNLVENFPVVVYYKWQACCILGLSLWLLNIPAILRVGSEVVTMWDHFAAGSSVLSCLIVHMLGWSWIYNHKRLHKDMEFMIQRRVSSLWTTSFATLVIVLLTIAELWGFFGLPLDGTGACKYPLWLTVSGWAMYLLALVVAVLVGALVVVQQVDYGLKAKLLTSIKPLRTWGPRDPLVHHSWKQFTESIAEMNLTYQRGISVSSLSVAEDSFVAAAPSTKNSMTKRTSVTIMRVPSRRDYTSS